MISRENFYKRLNEMAGIKTPSQEVNENSTLIDFEKSDEGISYGIVKENHHYFIKKSTSKNETLNESDFTYIGGLENKFEHAYDTLATAQKHRNLMIMSLNEAFSLGVKEEQESLNEGVEAKKEEKIDDVNSFLKNVITEGKKSNRKKLNERFKNRISETVETKEEKKSTGLMPETALSAVQKALGKINEEDIVTADSEIKDGDKVANKKGKEAPQAPINDSNAKAEADKADATGTEDFNKKEDPADSLAVNQQDSTLSEGEDLSTADSEINANESPANMVNATKEQPQAPINDTNAKSEADKADTESGSEAIANNVEESPESDPFDDKENAEDTKALVNADSNITEGATIDASKSEPFEDKAKDESGDEVTADSDHSDSDRVDNETKSEGTQAPYGAEKQPEKGHKEEKGAELKADAKKDGIWEGEDLSTKDSHIKDADKVANKTDEPSTDAESQIVKDSDLKPEDSVANDAKTNLPNPVYEGEDIITADGEIDAEDSVANDTTTNLPNPVAEAEADIDPDFMTEVFEGIEDIMDKKMDDLEDATDKEAAPVEEPAPEETPVEEPEAEMPAEEPAMDGGDDAIDMEVDGSDIGDVDLGDMDVDGGDEFGSEEGGEEVAAEEGGDDVKDLERNVGEVNQIASSDATELEPDKTKELFNSLKGSFEKHLKELPAEELEQIGDEIKDMAIESPDGEAAAEPMNDAGGTPEEEASELEAELDAEISGHEEEVAAENPEVKEEVCNECGTFESYATSRGYDNFGECSEAEMANMISDYAHAYKEGMNEGDFEGVSKFMTDGVKAELDEYGHGDYVNECEPFTSNINEGDMWSPSGDMGKVEVMPNVSEDDDEIEVETGEVDVDDAPEVEAPIEEPVDGPEVEVAAAPEEPQEVSFASGEVMGAGVPQVDGAKTTSVEVNSQSGTVTVNMSEGQDQVRKYIQNRLAELAGKKKPMISESKKSDKLKKLDKMIEEQWNLYGEVVKKKV